MSSVAGDEMRCFVVEPRDTLVVRDGRPARSDTEMSCLDFPMPSTMAGLARSEIGFDAERHFVGDPAALLGVEVAGPWLVALDADGRAADVFGPAPADAGWRVPVGEVERAVRFRRAPMRWPAGVVSDLAEELLAVLPVGEGAAGKPPADVPGFWRWSGERGLGAWLFRPSAAPEAFDADARADELGPVRLVDERRVHVSIAAETGTAKDGALFATTGLRLTWRATGSTRRLGVAFGCASAVFAEKAGRRPVLLGGEQRLSRLTALADGWPLPDEAGWRALAGARRLRVMLWTPAIFDAGYRPSEARLAAVFGEGARLVAAAVDRPQVVSGFDLARAKAAGGRGAEKPVRRAAPAGSVYWVDVPDGLTRARLEDAWMASLCDAAQDRLDGFGRIVLGVG